MFEGREEAAQKHVLLQQRQLTVCKQVERKKKEIWENGESENISLPAASHILSLSAFFLHRN